MVGPGVLQRGADDAVAGQHRALDGARDLGAPAQARAVAHGHLHGPIAEPGRLHHHLRRPAIGHFRHAQALEGRSADGPEGAQVRDLQAVEVPQEPHRQPVAEPLVGKDSPFLHLPQLPRP